MLTTSSQTLHIHYTPEPDQGSTELKLFRILPCSLSAGIYFLPPRLTLPARQPRTENSSAGDGIACHRPLYRTLPSEIQESCNLVITANAARQPVSYSLQAGNIDYDGE
jgi:hypothetical protein